MPTYKWISQLKKVVTSVCAQMHIDLELGISDDEKTSGVTMPEKTLVAAGAVVTKSVAESECLLAGVPAAVKKRYG